MSYGYGGRPNPFDQRGGAQAAAPQQAYNSDPYGARQQYNNAPTMGRDDFAGQNVEMERLTGNNNRPARGDANAILNQLRQIDQAIASVAGLVEGRRTLLQQSLGNVDSSQQMNRELDESSSHIMSEYRNLAGRIRSIKQQPEAGSPRNAAQLSRVDENLKSSLKNYNRMESDFQKKLRDQSARQYRIAFPGASEDEVRKAVEGSTNGQVFQQALLGSDRQGQSRSVRNAVEDRSREIKKIEQQMIEIGELFNQMNELVEQQEAAVANIEMKGEEVVENLDKGTEEIGVAVESAKKARKWKWWCLGISILIVIIIAVVIVIYKFVINGSGTTKAKRWVLPSSLDIQAINSARATTEKNIVVPGLEWTGDSKLVIPGKPWSGDAASDTVSETTTPNGGRRLKFSA